MTPEITSERSTKTKPKLKPVFFQCCHICPAIQVKR